MNVNFNGYGENVTTFIADDSVSAGVPVKITDNGTVSACATGDKFCGVCLDVRDGYASVQLGGYVELPAKTKISVGYQTLGVGAGGKIEASGTGREYLVVDSTATTAGIIL